MNKNILRIGTLAGSLVLAASAFSQIGPFTKPAYVKVAFDYPLSNDIRDGIAKNGFGAAVGFNLPKPIIIGTLLGSTSVELNYRRFNGNGSSFDGYGLQIVQRQPLIKVITPGPFGYFGVGIGMQYSKLDAAGVSTNKTTVSGQVLLGLDVMSKLFVELGYNYTPDIEGINTQSVSLSAGIRF